MSFKINTNIGALNAYNALAKVNADTYKAQIRLATQKRINNVGDDTSGFAVGKALAQKVTLMQAAQNNVGSAQDMLATAEGQLISVKDLITQIKGKIADAGNPAANKENLANDIKALAEEIGNIFVNTKFNDTNLLVSGANGAGAAFSYQTGASSSDKLDVFYAEDLVGTEDIAIGDSSLTGAVSNAVSDSLDDIESLTASTAVYSDFTDLSTNLDNFEAAVTDALSKIGNYSQRLTIKSDFLTQAIANSQSSVSRLFDADMAMEQLNATKGQIGTQIATAMLAQLNASPQTLLSLFQ